MRHLVLAYRLPLGVSGCLLLVDTLLGLARPWPLAFAVDHAVQGRPMTGWLAPLDGIAPGGLAAVAAAASVLLVLIGGVTGYLSRYLSGAAVERIGADLRAIVYRRLLTLSPCYHERAGGARSAGSASAGAPAVASGNPADRLTGDAARVTEALAALLVRGVPDLVTLSGLLVAMLVVDPAIAVAALVVVPPFAVLAVVRRRQSAVALRDARDRQDELAELATGALRDVRAVQAAGDDAEFERYRQRSGGAVRAALHALDLRARYGAVTDLLLTAGAGLILLIGVDRVASGRMSLGTLLVVLAYLAAAYRPVRSLTRLQPALAAGAQSRVRLHELLNSTGYVRQSAGAQPVPERPERLAVRELSFGYDQGRPVLRGLDLELRRGELVCLVGAAGAGKSTALALLPRLFDPDRGAVLLDGADVRAFTLGSLRDRIALVPHDPWLPEGTIADAIADRQPDATRAEIVRASRAALAHPFVQELPDRYRTAVGPGGVLLPGPRRRQVALARVLLRDCDVLLLDEPTDGLHPRGEAEAMAAIRRAAADRMVLVATSRPAVAAHADRILVLADGRITDAGTPAQLVARGGTFADWFQSCGVDAPRPARLLVPTG